MASKVTMMFFCLGMFMMGIMNIRAEETLSTTSNFTSPKPLEPTSSPALFRMSTHSASFQVPITTYGPVITTTNVQVVTTKTVPVINTTDGQVVTTTTVPVINTTDGQVVTTTTVPVMNTTDGQVVTTTTVPVMNTTDVQALTITAVPVMNTTDVQVVTTTAVPVMNTTDVQVVTTTTVPMMNTTDDQHHVGNTTDFPMVNTTGVSEINITNVQKVTTTEELRAVSHESKTTSTYLGFLAIGGGVGVTIGIMLAIGVVAIVSVCHRKRKLLTSLKATQKLDKSIQTCERMPEHVYDVIDDRQEIAGSYCVLDGDTGAQNSQSRYYITPKRAHYEHGIVEECNSHDFNKKSYEQGSNINVDSHYVNTTRFT